MYRKVLIALLSFLLIGSSVTVPSYSNITGSTIGGIEVKAVTQEKTLEDYYKCTIVDGMAVFTGFLSGYTSAINYAELGTSFKIPESVVVEGKSYKVCGVGKLTNMPNIISTIIIPAGIITFQENMLYNNTTIKNVIIEQGSKLQNVGVKAFYGSAVESVNLEEAGQLLYIDTSAFQNAVKLKAITIPASVVKIGANAFKGIRSTDIVGNDIYMDLQFEQGSKLVLIESGAFSESNIKTLSFSNLTQLQTIKDTAFKNVKCESCQCVLGKKVQSIGASAFYGLKGRTGYSINMSGCTNLTSIGASAFSYSGCTSLTFPDGEIDMPNTAVKYCTDLQKVMLGYDMENSILTALKGTKTVVYFYRGSKAYFVYQGLTSSVKSNCNIAYRDITLPCSKSARTQVQLIVDTLYNGESFDTSKLHVKLTSKYGAEEITGDALTDIFTIKTKQETSGAVTVTLEAKSGTGFKGTLGSSSTAENYDLTKAKVTLTDMQAEGYYLASGNKAITPAVSVEVDGKVLTRNIDYTVEYKNNTGVDGKNKPSLTIVAKGANITGTCTKNFVIKEDLSSAYLKGELSAYTSSGDIKDGSYFVADNVFLKVNKDTVAPAITNMTLYNSQKKVVIPAGQYTYSTKYVYVRGTCGAGYMLITVKANTNSDYWCGQAQIKVNMKAPITEAEMSAKVGGKTTEIAKETDINKLSRYMMKRADGVNISYTGAEIKPILTLRMNGGTLNSLDYTTTYGRNLNVETSNDFSKMAYVRYQAIQTSYYYGSRTIYFMISPHKVSERDCSFSSMPNPENVTYTGKAITMSGFVSQYAYCNGMNLVEGTDYKVVYKDNLHAGKATLEVQGTGNYSGSVSVNFNILPADIADCTISYTSFWALNDIVKPVPVLKYNGVVVPESEYKMVYFKEPASMMAECTAQNVGDVGYLGVIASTTAKDFKVTTRANTNLSSTELESMQTSKGYMYRTENVNKPMGLIRKYTVKTLDLSNANVEVHYGLIDAQNGALIDTTSVVHPEFVINGVKYNIDKSFFMSTTASKHVCWDGADGKKIDTVYITRRTDSAGKPTQTIDTQKKTITYTDNMYVESGGKPYLLATLNYQFNWRESAWLVTKGEARKCILPSEYEMQMTVKNTKYMFATQQTYPIVITTTSAVMVDTKTHKELTSSDTVMADYNSANICFRGSANDDLDGNTRYTVVVKDKKGQICKTVVLMYADSKHGGHCTKGLTMNILDNPNNARLPRSPYYSYTITGLSAGKSYDITVEAILDIDGVEYQKGVSNVGHIVTKAYSGSLQAVTMQHGTDANYYDITYSIVQPYTNLADNVHIQYFVCLYNANNPSKYIKCYTNNGASDTVKGSILKATKLTPVQDKGEYYVTLVTKMWIGETSSDKSATLTVCTNSSSTSVNNIQYPLSFAGDMNGRLTLSSKAISLGEGVNATANVSGGKAPYTFSYTLERQNGGAGVTCPLTRSNDGRYVVELPASVFNVGDYTLKVWCRDSNNVRKELTATIAVNANIVNKSVLATDWTVQYKPVRVYFKSENAVGTPEYKLSAKLSSDKNYTLLQDYTATGYYDFSPARSGTYELRIVAKGADGNYQIVYKTLVVEASTFKATTKVSVTEVAVNTAVTLSASATGGTENYSYAFYYQESGSSSWVAIKGYSATKKGTFKPTKVGAYKLCIKVKDSNGSEIKKYYDLKVT